jgi:hypothetical protein
MSLDCEATTSRSVARPGDGCSPGPRTRIRLRSLSSSVTRTRDSCSSATNISIQALRSVPFSAWTRSRRTLAWGRRGVARRGPSTAAAETPATREWSVPGSNRRPPACKAAKTSTPPNDDRRQPTRTATSHARFMSTARVCSRQRCHSPYGCVLALRWRRLEGEVAGPSLDAACVRSFAAWYVPNSRRARSERGADD